MDQRKSENNNVADVLSLGRLYQQDLPEACIFPFYPISSSVNEKYPFINKEKYRVFDTCDWIDDARPWLVAMRCCCVVGDELPISLHQLPSDFMLAHWKKWCPHYRDPVVKSIDECLAGDKPLITSLPFEGIPKERHAVEPEMHYQVLTKSAIADTGAPYPKYFNEENIEFPCMIKVDHSHSGYGNFVAKDREEFEKFTKWIQETLGRDTAYIISQYVQGVEYVFNCGFYVTKSGDVICIGIEKGDQTDDFAYECGYVDWDKHDEYKKRFYDKFVAPVAEYLHKKGYFGVVGMDIIASPAGDDYLVDLNPRLNGNTAQLMLASRMATLGLPKSIFKLSDQFDVTSEQLVEKANSLNEANGGKIIIMAAVDVGDKCCSSFAVFGESNNSVDFLFDKLCGKD